MTEHQHPQDGNGHPEPAARDVRRVLEDAADVSTGFDHAGAAWAQAGRRRRRTVIGVGGVAAAGLAAGIVLAQGLLGGTEEEEPADPTPAPTPAPPADRVFAFERESGDGVGLGRDGLGGSWTLTAVQDDPSLEGAVADAGPDAGRLELTAEGLRLGLGADCGTVTAELYTLDADGTVVAEQPVQPTTSAAPCDARLQDAANDWAAGLLAEEVVVTVDGDRLTVRVPSLPGVSPAEYPVPAGSDGRTPVPLADGLTVVPPQGWLRGVGSADAGCLGDPGAGEPGACAVTVSDPGAAAPEGREGPRCDDGSDPAVEERRTEVGGAERAECGDGSVTWLLGDGAVRLRGPDAATVDAVVATVRADPGIEVTRGLARVLQVTPDGVVVQPLALDPDASPGEDPMSEDGDPLPLTVTEGTVCLAVDAAAEVPRPEPVPCAAFQRWQRVPQGQVVVLHDGERLLAVAPSLGG